MVSNKEDCEQILSSSFEEEENLSIHSVEDSPAGDVSSSEVIEDTNDIKENLTNTSSQNGAHDRISMVNSESADLSENNTSNVCEKSADLSGENSLMINTLMQLVFEMKNERERDKNEKEDKEKELLNKNKELLNEMRKSNEEIKKSMKEKNKIFESSINELKKSNRVELDKAISKLSENQSSYAGSLFPTPQTLQREERLRLEKFEQKISILSKMIQNKESDENIKFVVNDFKKKSDLIFFLYQTCSMPSSSSLAHSSSSYAINKEVKVWKDF